MKFHEHDTSDKIHWRWIEVSKREAYALIQSLTNQLLAESPNVGRLESRVKNEHGGEGGYLTIAIVEENNGTRS